MEGKEEEGVQGGGKGVDVYNTCCKLVWTLSLNQRYRATSCWLACLLLATHIVHHRQASADLHDTLRLSHG